MNKFFKALMLSLVLIPCTFLFIGCGEVMNLTSSQLQSQYLITDYDGTEKKPNVQVYIGQKLIPATNYTTTYANNINAGVATITVTGKNGYIGKKTRNFEIKQLNLSTAGPTITLAGSSFVYTNNPIEPAVTSVVVKDAIIPTTEYDIAYSDNTNPGTATVTISGKGSNVTGLATKTFSITGGEITMTSENTVVNLVQDEFEYTGSAIINAIDSIQVDGEALVEGDYIAIYSNNVELGTASITITGQGGYRGTITKTFEIVKNLSTAVISLESATEEYSKSPIVMPITSVLLGTQTLTEQDYTVEYLNNINAGEATAKIMGAGNYRGVATTTFEITKKSITVDAISEASITKTYDGTTDATSLITPAKYEFTGIIAGDIVTLSGTATFNDANAETDKTITVTDLSIDNDNYNLTTTSFEIAGTITAKDLTVAKVAEAPAITKVYDGTAEATNLITASHYTFDGLVNEEQPSILNFTFTEVFNSANVTEANQIIVSSLAINNSNYNLTTTGDFTYTATITKKTLTVAANQDAFASKTYDGTLTTDITGLYTFDGVVNEDIVNLIATAEFNDKNASLANLVTVSVMSVDNSNYNLTTESFTIIGAIIAKEITAQSTGVNVTKTYDGTTDVNLSDITDQYEFTGLVGTEELTLNAGFTATFNDANVGTDKIITVGNATITSTNYTLSNSTFTIAGTITAKDLTVAAKADTSITKEYNGNNTATVTTAHYEFVGLIGEDTATLTFTTAAFDSANVTAETVNVTGLSINNTNYNLTTESFAIAGTITAKDLTVVAKADARITKTYNGTTDVTLSDITTDHYEFDGLEGEDTVTLNAGFTATFNDANVGTNKTVTVSDLNINNTNYKLTTTSFTLVGTITAKDLTVAKVAEAPAITKVYDGTTATTGLITTSHYTFDGLVGEDTVTLTFTAAFDNANVGTNKTVTVSDLNIDNTNYNLTTENFTLVGTITAKSLGAAVITLAEGPYEYTGSELTPEVTAVVLDSKTLTVTTDYTAAYSNNTNVGTATVTITGTGNYSGTATTTFTITAREITVEATAVKVSKVYNEDTDATVTAEHYTLTNVVEGDTVTLTVTAVYSSAEVGDEITVTVTVTAVSNPNYTLTSFELTGEITEA